VSACLKAFEAAVENSKSTWSTLQRLSDHVIAAMKLAPGDYCALIASSKGRAAHDDPEKGLTIAVKLFYHEMEGQAADLAKGLGAEASGSVTRASSSISSGASGIWFQSNSLDLGSNKTSSLPLG
jgi:hypothetical protein